MIKTIKTIVRIHYICIILCLIFSCEKDFQKINIDPSIVDEINPDFLLTYSLNNLQQYRGTEWIWEDLEQTLRYSQLLTANPYDFNRNAINSRYRQYYEKILPNLFEIRRINLLRPDSGKFRNYNAITFIAQVYHGLKVSDVSGDIPYSEAMLGRIDGTLNPKYDSQESLYNSWLKELNDAIFQLSQNTTDQINPGAADIFYAGNWIYWIKLANSIKLRIALRLELQRPELTELIFQEVMNDSYGPILEAGSQFIYYNEDYDPIGNIIDYRSRRFANESMIDFMKVTKDPRINIYFKKNSLVGNWKEDFLQNSVKLPKFIDLEDSLVYFQGGPMDWSSGSDKVPYFIDGINIGNNNYQLISSINPIFFAPKMNGGTGIFKDILYSDAEVYFIIAELLFKGYGDEIVGINDVEYWYEKGISASIRNMIDIANSAQMNLDSKIDIDAYKKNPFIQLGETDVLEKIYIQKWLNFFRSANEAFVLVRRTGFPYKDSNYIRWAHPGDEIYPRRFWTSDPGVVNATNWIESLQKQGFSIISYEKPILNKERLWFDLASPNFGERD